MPKMIMGSACYFGDHGGCRSAHCECKCHEGQPTRIHEGAIVDQTWAGTKFEHRAHCPCGWSKPHRDTLGEALTDLKEHQANPG